MKRRLVWAIAIIGVAVFAWYVPRAGAKRPRYVFVNETSDHRHDLALKMSLKLAEKRSGIENALILLPRLPEGETLEVVAERLFRGWDIGRMHRGKGILYLFSARENLLKIELSYALEGKIPDVECRRLEEAAKSYMLSEVPQDFLSELIITMNIEGNGEVPPASLDRAKFLSGGAGAFSRGFRRSIAEISNAIKQLPRVDLDAYEAGVDAEETLHRYLRSLESGIGDPRLPLLTTGSQTFRFVVPRTPDQLWRMSRDYARAAPMQLVTQGKYALAVFRPGTSTLPVVLHRDLGGRWRVDEVKAWTWFHRFENDSNFFPRFAEFPLAEALARTKYPTRAQPVYKHWVQAPPTFGGQSLVETIAARESALAKQDTARAHAELGELYRFETNWLSRAIEQFAAAAAIAPAEPEYHWRLWDLYLDNSEVENALIELGKLQTLLPDDKEVAEWEKYYRGAYAFAPGEFSE